MDLSILWKGRTEGVVHHCLEEGFRKQGYNVINLHEIDRSHEGGADLECVNSEEKIYIQAKIKPRKEDIEQLYRLSKLKPSKLIYVYIEDPSTAFKREQNKIKGVDFWDKEKLHKFLIDINSNKYFRLIFLSSPAIRDMVNLLEIITSCKNTEPTSLEKDEQMITWLLFKDRTVKLHTSLELIYEWYKKELLSKDRINQEEIKNYLKKIFSLLIQISINSSDSLVKVVREIKTKYPQLLAEYIKVTKGRSNWIGMPYNTENNLREEIEGWILPEEREDSTFYNLINSYLNNLRDRAEAIEDGVDWLLEDKFKTTLPR